MKIKKKIPKKREIPEPEELQGLLLNIFSKVKEAFGRYRSLAIVSITVIVILCIGTAVYYYMLNKWDKEASALENKAYDYFLDGDYQKALSTYQDILKNYSTSKSMPIAMYYAANSFLGMGQADQAIQTYQKFIEKYKGQETILPLVYVNLAYAYMSKKEYSNAISAFKEASTRKGSLVADRAVYETARAYEVSGDRVSAMERYEYLKKTYPNSPWSQDASAKLEKAQGGTVKEQPQQQPQPQDKQQPPGINKQ